MTLTLADCEYIILELNTKVGAPMLLIILYRPPNSDLASFNQQLNQLIELADLKHGLKKKVFFTGDFNTDLLKSNHHHNSEEFLNIMLSNGFLPSITRPTQITDSSATL